MAVNFVRRASSRDITYKIHRGGPVFRRNLALGLIKTGVACTPSMATIHTVILPDGTKVERRSENRQYVACVTVTRTQAAFDAIKAKREAALAEAQTKFTTLVGDRPMADWAAERAAEEAAYKTASDALEELSPGLGDPGWKDHWNKVTALIHENCNSPSSKVDYARRELDRARESLAMMSPVGRVQVNSWHMTLKQAHATAANRACSMACIHALDAIEVRTDITTRVAGKKAAA
jgi:hypothetical protein